MRKVSLRTIVAHKLRLALTLMAVMLGTAFIAGSFMFTNALSSTFDSAVSNAFTGVDAAVSPGEGQRGIDKQTQEDIANDDQVAAVNVRDTQSIVVANEDREAYQTGAGSAQLIAYYPPEQVVGQAGSLADGSTAPQGTGEAVIDAAAAERFDINVGDTVVVVTPAEQFEVTISGIITPAVEQPAGLQLQMDAESYVEKFHPDGSVTQLAVAGAGDVDASELVDHLSEEYDVNAETGEKLAEEISSAISEGMKFVNYFLIAFGLIALLVGTFIIANTFSMIVAQRTKEFALLRALGASRGQITGSVVMESIVVGLIGSALGVVAGIGLVAVIRAVLSAQDMPIDGGGLGLDAKSIIIPLILGTVVTVVSAWAPARRAGTVKPVEAMRSTEAAAGSSLRTRTVAGAIFLALGAGLALWGAMADYSTTNRAILVGAGAVAAIIGFFLAGPALSLPLVPRLGRGIGKPFGAIGALAATNSQRNPRRASATAFALLLGVALVTAIGMLGATMKQTVAETVESNISADFVLTGPTNGSFPTPAETADRARETDGVAQVVSMSLSPVTVDGKSSISYGGQFSQTLTIDANPENVLRFSGVEGSMDIEKTPGFIATDEFAEANGWEIGESYEMTAPTPGAKPQDVTLVGTFEPNNLLDNMVVFEDLATEVTGPGMLTLNMVGINGEDGVDDDQLRANLTEAVKDLLVVQVMSAEDVSGEAATAINQMLNILYALLALAVIIAVLGIINTLTLGVIERRQEIGMLRAVGTQRGQIRTMITLEAVQIAVFGAVMGMLIGLGLGWAFIEVLAGVGLDSFAIPWGQLVIMLLGSAVVGVVAAIWPAQRAAKTPPLEAIAD